MGHPRLNFFYNLLYSRWLSFGEERKRWLSLGQPFPQILLCPINCLVERFTLAQVAMSYHIYGPLPKATRANNMSWPFSNNQTIPPNNFHFSFDERLTHSFKQSYGSPMKLPHIKFVASFVALIDFDGRTQLIQILVGEWI